MKEPITTDKRISYVNANNRLVVYDRPTKCALCNRCLADHTGHCPFGGPFPPLNARIEDYATVKA